jgi:hypothetical protein
MKTLLRPHRESLAAAALVAGVVALAWALVGHYGLRTHALLIYDEKFAVEGARWLNDDLARVVGPENYANRGVERLSAVILMPVLWVSKSTSTQFVLGHLLFALLFALQAVPAFLLGRGLGLRKVWALVGAGLSVLGPWAVFGTLFLNNVPSSAAAGFALWAMWRAVVTPGWWWDLATLGFITVAALGRVSTAALAAALPLAIVVDALRYELLTANGPLPRRALNLAGTLVRRHWMLLALGLLVLLVVARNPTAVVGFYPTKINASSAAVGHRFLETITALTAGTAFLGAALGGGWVVRQVVRPAGREQHAFALLAVGAFVALIWVTLGSANDERYHLPLMMPLAVAFAAALGRRETGLVSSGGAALVCWLGLHRYGQISVTLPTDYLTWPSKEWFSEVWLGRLWTYTHIAKDTLVDLVGIAGTAAALAVAFLRRSRYATGAAVAVAAVVVAVSAAGSVWAMQKLSNSARPQVSFDAVTFVDQVTGGRRADPLGSTAETDPGKPQLWNELQFFNDAIQHPLSLEGKVYDLCCQTYGFDQVASVDRNTGALSSDAPLPPFVLTVPQWLPAGPATEPVFTSSVFGVRVERLPAPAMAAWVSEGVDPYGWVRPKVRAKLRVFPKGLATRGDPCLRVTLSAPQLPAGEQTRWRIGASSGRLAGGAQERVDVPLNGTRPRDLAVSAVPSGPDPATQKPARLGLSDLRLIGCGVAEPAAKLAP